MKIYLGSALVYFLAVSVSAAPAPSAFSPKGNACSFKTFMQNYVRATKDAPHTNTFLVAMTAPHPDGEFWVYWPQKRQIILVAWPSIECKSPALTVSRHLDLNKDVVKTQAGAGTSTYPVTEAWAEDILLDAARSGYQITVTK